MLPLRMNTTRIKIRRLSTEAAGSTTSTVVDPQFFHHSADKVYDEEEYFTAQLEIKAEARRVRMALGNIPWVDGYLVYRSPADATKRLKVGDKVTGIPDGAGGYDVVDFVVCENSRHASLPNPLIYCAYFKRNEDNTTSN